MIDTQECLVGRGGGLGSRLRCIIQWMVKLFNVPGLLWSVESW